MQMLYKYNVLDNKRNFEHICYFLDTPWIIVTGISSLIISCIAFCVCVLIVRKQCARRKSLQRLSAAMDDVSVTEFGFENVKLD